jgi:hypothetical protein
MPPEEIGFKLIFIEIDEERSQAFYLNIESEKGVKCRINNYADCYALFDENGQFSIIQDNEGNFYLPQRIGKRISGDSDFGIQKWTPPEKIKEIYSNLINLIDHNGHYKREDQFCKQITGEKLKENIPLLEGYLQVFFKEMPEKEIVSLIGFDLNKYYG